MDKASRGDELIDVVVRLPRRAIEDTLLSAQASGQDLDQRRLATAKALLAARRRRATSFAGLRFYDPSWDMILELYVAMREQRDLAVSQLCGLSGGSTTTALRHLEHMEALGYVRRASDSNDRRRLIVTMLAPLTEAVDKWLDLQIAGTRLGL